MQYSTVQYSMCWYRALFRRSRGKLILLFLLVRLFLMVSWILWWKAKGKGCGLSILSSYADTSLTKGCRTIMKGVILSSSAAMVVRLSPGGGW